MFVTFLDLNNVLRGGGTHALCFYLHIMFVFLYYAAKNIRSSWGCPCCFWIIRSFTVQLSRCLSGDGERWLSFSGLAYKPTRKTKLNLTSSNQNWLLNFFQATDELLWSLLLRIRHPQPWILLSEPVMWGWKSCAWISLGFSHTLLKKVPQINRSLMSFSDFKELSLGATLPNRQHGMSAVVIGILARHLLVARCRAPPEVSAAIKKNIVFLSS